MTRVCSYLPFCLSRCLLELRTLMESWPPVILMSLLCPGSSNTPLCSHRVFWSVTGNIMSIIHSDIL